MRVKLKKYKYHTIRTFSNSNSDTPYAHIDFHMGIHAIKRNEEKPSSISLQLVIIHTQSSGWSVLLIVLVSVLGVSVLFVFVRIQCRQCLEIVHSGLHYRFFSNAY